MFETRRPEVRAWESWVDDLTTVRATLADGTVVDTSFALLDVRHDAGELDQMDGPLTVSFRWTYVCDPDGPAPEALVSDSTLRFRERDEIEQDLATAGFAVDGVHDAPDRPGREWVFVARACAPADAECRT